MGVSCPMCPNAISMTRPIPCLAGLSASGTTPIHRFFPAIRKRGNPYLSISCMLNAFMPCSLRIFFSPLSMSRKPMYTNFFKLKAFSSPNHPNISAFSSLASPVRKATGIPWMLPLSLVSGVLMSACASTQITAISLPSRSLMALEVPAIVPIAMEWSPPRVSTKRPCFAWSYT